MSADFETEVLPHLRDLRALALYHTRNAADADDLVQETLLRALAAWERYVPGSCGGWLHRILMNTFISGVRKRKRGREELRNNVEIASAPDVRADLGDEVLAALESASESHRTLLEMVDLRETAYCDAAERLGVPIGTVMSRLHRARAALAERVSDYAAREYGIGGRR